MAISKLLPHIIMNSNLGLGMEGKSGDKEVHIKTTNKQTNIGTELHQVLH